MKHYYEDGGLRLFHGSNKDIMPTFGAESFDSVVTDPPYEIGFMGKGWDSSGIAYDVEMWRECWRVLKPGGYLLAFGGTRTWHRIATAIEDAGFEIRDSMAWLYGSGFPKSMDVSKAIDKASGFVGEVTGSETVDVGMQGGKMHTGRPKQLAERDIRALSDDASEWAGWGTALKPAFEPIIVARKPLRGTVAANVLAYGTGAINIDATRVPTTENLNGGAYTERATVSASLNPSGMNVVGAKANGDYAQPTGRFPSNVLLDASQAAELDRQAPSTGGSGKASGPSLREPTGASVAFGARNGTAGEPAFYGGDKGGASRFFPTFRYEAKAPGHERPEVDGVAHATVKPLDLMRWLVRLVTRRGGRVLDPFAGSGTTGEAALLEGMEAVLIELEETHLPLILQRVRKPLQPSMFGDWEETA